MTSRSEVMFPLKEYLGFTVQAGEASAMVIFELDERHMNPNGVAHGSMPFALMDTAMGAAVMSVIDEDATCATIEIHARYHRAVASGLIAAEATVMTAGRRIIHLEARTMDADGNLVASATGSFAVIALSA